MKYYITFNGITFANGNYYNWVYTPYVVSEFEPNGIETQSQKDDLIVDGAVYSNFRYDARMISIKGTILPQRTETLEELRQQLVAKINGKKMARMTYFDGTKMYFCDCFGDIPVFGKKFGGGKAMEFNINFTVPDCYWYAAEKTYIPIGSRTDNLTTSFTLPKIFTTRVSIATINNSNEFDLLPIIKIYVNSAITSNGSITVKNETTDKSITLTGCAVDVGSTIEIDLKNMTAKCGNVDIINYFTDFSDFTIVPGDNVLKCLDSNNNAKNIVTVEFYQPYVGI